MELATRVGADADALRRLLRMLASHGIFAREGPDRFALNEAADCLRNDSASSLRDLVLYYGAEPQQAWSELGYSVRTGKPAFDRVFGEGVWDYFDRHPDAARVFDGAMRGRAPRRARILGSYPFREGATVVDLGGGNGGLLVELLSSRADLEGVVVDRPRVIEEARAKIAEAGLESRCRAVAGDLFSDLPEGGDAYVLAIVLHD